NTSEARLRAERLLRSAGEGDIDPDWLRDVLENMLALVDEGRVELVADLLGDGLRDEDGPWLGDAFEAHVDVDALAIDLVGLDDHVADIEADVVLGMQLGRNVGIAPAHPELDVESATHGLDDAREFREDAVARALHHAPVAFLDGRLDQLGKRRDE